jgi:hypothetical protein
MTKLIDHYLRHHISSFEKNNPKKKLCKTSIMIILIAPLPGSKIKLEHDDLDSAFIWVKHSIFYE